MNRSQNTAEFTCLASDSGFETGHRIFNGDAWQAKQFATKIAKGVSPTAKPIVRGEGWQWIER